MKPTTEHIRAKLYNRLGIDDPPALEARTAKHILSTQWSLEFERLMRNRLAMGAIRYGGLKHGAKNKKAYDSVGSAISRLQKYKESGNDEHLVDAANLCLVEFVNGSHPKKHFHSSDDGEHAKEIK